MTDPIPEPDKKSDESSSFNGSTSAITAIGAKTRLLVAYAAAALGVKVSGIDESKTKGGNGRSK